MNVAVFLRFPMHLAGDAREKSLRHRAPGQVKRLNLIDPVEVDPVHHRLASDLRCTCQYNKNDYTGDLLFLHQIYSRSKHAPTCGHHLVTCMSHFVVLRVPGKPKISRGTRDVLKYFCNSK